MLIIHMTSTARKLFEAKAIGVDSWIIPATEKDRIASHCVGITVYSPPASVLDLQDCSLPNYLRHLIIIDISLFRQYELSSRKLIAILLHEIGHIVNPPPVSEDNGQEIEIYADYYTRHCGYGIDFATALGQMRDIGMRGFNSGSVDSRISLLREDTEPRLNLQKG